MSSIFFVLAILLVACQNKSKVQSAESSETKSETNNSLTTKENVPFLKHFNKEFKADSYSFFVDAQNDEQTSVKIYSKGLEHEYNEVFKIEGQVKAGHLLDQNKDGFKELYLILSQTDDSGNLDIMGIASNRDKSASEIYVKENYEIRQMNSDRVFVQNNMLMRTFVNKDRQKVTFAYPLRTGETSYILEPKLVD